MKPTNRFRIVLLLAPLPFLGACSDGSGGGPSVPTEPVGITEENAAQVAAGMPMAASLMDFQETMSFDTLTADGTGTFFSPDGGSVTAGFEVDAAPVGEVSTGDRFAVSFDNFVVDPGPPQSSINGGIVIDFQTINGDWTVDPVWEVDIGFQVNGLTFSSGPATGFIDASWSQNASYDNGDAAYSLAGDFTASANDGTGWRSAALDGLDLSWSYDAVAAESTYGVDGRFASTELGGSVTVDTLTPFVLRDGDDNPYAGSMRATGAAGTSLTFTVLNNVDVQLDIDVDGDGFNDVQVLTTWDVLHEEY
jgi:hypothetical protein